MQAFKGSYTMTFSPNGNSDDNQMSITNYLNEKVKCLEIENNELKKEVAMKCGDIDKTDYFLRLRRELLEEIEKLKNVNVAQELSCNAEIEKMQEEIGALGNKLKNAEMSNVMSPGRIEEEMTTLNDNVPLKSPTSLLSNSKYFQNVIENEVVTNYSEENFFLNPLVSGQNLLHHVMNSDKSNKERDNMNNNMFLTSPGANLIQSEENQKEITSFTLPQSGMNNPLIPLINDLEERIKQLEYQVQQKDQEIVKHEEVKEVQKTENNSELERLQKESDLWKQKYIQVLTNKKSLSEEFQELYVTKTSNFQMQSEKSIFELEKKILYLEKMNTKYEDDFEKLAKMNADAENVKQTEIENLKLNFKTIVANYEDVYKTYEENLKVLLKQMDAYKQLYLARETEFLNITNYYTETIKEYAKPIADLTGNQFRAIEDNFISQTKEVEELRRNLERLLKELATVTEECVSSKSEIRQKVADSMRIYEENLSNIIETHSSLQAKLESITDFINFFDEKNVFFNSLLEENKKLQEKVNDLECQLKKVGSDSKDKDFVVLKEQVFMLQKENDIKSNLIKEYEEIIPKYQESLTSLKSKKVRENVSEEVVLKLKNEISILTNQISGLNKTKESIEKFYQVELRTSMGKINEKNEKIEELRAVIKKMENDIRGKKETVFNLYMLEFKDFKENLITITEIKKLIDKFKIEGEELGIHKDRVYNEELYLMRQEIKAKDDLSDELKNSFALEKKYLVDYVEKCKTTFDSKLSIIDTLISQKNAEIACLKNEKGRLGGIENAKKKITESELSQWNDQKEQLQITVMQHGETKDKEISFLKNQIEILQNELENSRKQNENNLQVAITSIENQMTLFKERELFTVSQLMDLEEKFRIYREEKERLNLLLKDEIQDLKGHNALLSKIKS